MILRSPDLEPVQIITTGAVVLAAALFCLTPWGKSFDHLVLDSLFYLRGSQATPTEVVVVAIDETSFAEIGRQWPWPRSLHAQLIDELFAAGAKGVALDIIFAEPSRREEDARLAAAISSHNTVVLATDYSVIERERYIQEIRVGPPPTLLGPEPPVGYINFPTDNDGFVRRLQLAKYNIPTFALAAARLMDPDCCKQMRGQSVDEVLINFVGPPDTISTVSYYQALKPGQFLPPETFKDKIVFVGLATHSAADPSSRTPDHFPAPYSRWGHGYVPGVVIHANAAHNLLSENAIIPIDAWRSLGTGLLLAIALAALFLFVAPLYSFLIVLIALLCLSVVTLYLFAVHYIYLSAIHLALPLVAGYLLSPFFHYQRQRNERRFIETAFSTYLAPTVVKELIANPERLQLGGQSLETTILFLDIAGFTALSERFDAKTLVQIMNRFLDKITNIVISHDGMIDKFIGDAVMAVWGAPIANPKHGQLACEAALQIRSRLQTLASEELSLTGAAISARMGINSGNVVAGNIGGEKRFDYTVLGNEVNLASRLEGVNKLYNTEIIIGENTHQLLDGEFELREIDAVRVKGKTVAVRIFELQGPTGSLDKTQAQRNQHFAEGLGHYKQQSWQTAIEEFQLALEHIAHDGPALVYVERCKELNDHPPSPDWDGVYDITTK